MCEGERFAWEVTYFGLPVARWEHRLENDGDALRLVEAATIDAADSCEWCRR